MFENRHLNILVLICFAIVLLGTSSAYAATISCGKIDLTEENGGLDYKITVNYTASSYQEGEQVTMLILTGTDAIVFDEEETDKPVNIVYIDQQPIENSNDSFTFLLKKSLVQNNKIFIKLGASSILQPSDKTYTFVSGSETGHINVSEAINAFGLEGQSLLIITTENTLPEEAVVKVNGHQMYKIANYGAVNKYVAIVSGYDNSTPEFVAANGENQEIIIGDTNADGNINSSDISVIIGKIIRGTSFDEIINICSDFNGDGLINITDVTYLYDYVNGNIIDIPALNR
ncbi:MAG: dockerin type I repeat-containing protein [Clostridia bacterium]|nr:dockerin type I repeat-containing protein [Clostridia bacterium]